MNATHLLLACYCVLAPVLLVAIAKRDLFFAVFFVFLIVYSAFAIVGYTLFPEFSKFIGMYFGAEVMEPVLSFTIASMAAVFFFFRVIYIPITSHARVRLLVFRPLKPIILLIFAALLIAQIGFFFTYATQLDYNLASDDEHTASLGIAFKFAFVEFKFSSFYIVVLYGLSVLGTGWRTVNKVPLLALLALHLAIFVAIVVQLGDRNDPLKVLLGMVFVEVMRRAEPTSLDLHEWPLRLLNYVRPRTWGLIAAAVVASVGLLSLLAYLRNPGADLPNASRIVQAALFQDYYYPFHMLILAVANDYVDPAKVLESNAANALAFLQVPYLQFFIMDQGNAGVVTRSSSMALYIFGEGFVAAGIYGFLYNGVVISAFLTLWRLFSKTNDRALNIIAGALFVALAADIVRGQTSYFIRCLYLFVLPGLSLFCLAVGRIPFGVRFVKMPRQGEN